MNSYKQIFSFTIMMFLSLSLMANNIDQKGEKVTFEIVQVEADEVKKALYFYIKAFDINKQKILGLSADRFELTEFNEGEKFPLVIELPEDISVLNNELEPGLERAIKVLFLLDMSGSMIDGRGDKLKQAKQAIRTALSSGSLSNVAVEFAWFHDDVSASIPLTGSNYGSVVQSLSIQPGYGKDTDLHRALHLKITEMAAFNGDKVIIMLTDGENDIRRNPNYYGRDALMPISQKELLDQIAQLDSTFRIFPVGIGMGANKRFLDSIIKATPNTEDSYAHGVTPQDISGTTAVYLKGLKPNVRIRVEPNQEFPIYGQESRTFKLNYRDNYHSFSTSKKANLGGLISGKFDLRRTSTVNKVDLFFGGFIGLALFLLLLVLAVPLFSNYQFKRNYIRKYKQVKRKGVSKRDPLTMDILEDDDTVVTRDNTMMLYDSWKYLRQNGEGELTKDYALLFQSDAKGGFFSQNGIYKKLNWLWFGALGGFLAWCIQLFFGHLDFHYLAAFLEVFDSPQKQVSSSIFNQTIVGAAVGTGLVMSLAIVEELGQSRKFSFFRILIRIGLGGIITTVVFFLVALFVVTFFDQEYLGSVIGWTILGTAIGGIISIHSSVQALSGLKGGLIASLLAFHIYFGLKCFAGSILSSAALLELLSLIIYGAVLGLILRVVISWYEDFELRCLSPSSFSNQVIAISKWLKASEIDYIYGGTNDNCHVLIKDTDEELEGKHFKLSYENKKVFIEAIAETLLNDALLESRQVLNNGDKIQLGVRGNYVFQFIAKKKSDKPASKNTGKHNVMRNHTSDQRKKIKNRIKAKRRTQLV